ncbi:hypothetical protein [Photobacterium sanguinicancri]|uniref:hypothetical protein n=1 Tax=Photobacterium sanguinicancri TaxID=875932 RepID=UPI003D103D36
MPLLPGRSTWLNEVKLKTVLIKRDKHATQGRQIQSCNHENYCVFTHKIAATIKLALRFTY